MRRKLHLGLGSLLGALLVTAACKDDTQALLPGVQPGDGSDGSVDVETAVPGDGEHDFISDVNVQSGSGGGLFGESTNAAAPSTQGADASGNTEAQRAISEADILQLSGDRLYALSRFSGLSIVDVSNPRALRLEGVYRSAAEPFEMYVEDGVVFAMFNSWYSYECDAEGICNWQMTSRMQALDARDPSNIQLLADYQVPGSIDDSRRVGDVLYLATHESNFCWNCQQQDNTTITSFDISNPSQLLQMDQLRLPAPAQTFRGQRSVSATNQRIYVSAWEWNGTEGSQHGSIDVIDISDPYGALVRGANVPIAGEIRNRWQMDESDGVLRVISQPGGWGTDRPPVLETFRVDSSASLQRAGNLTIHMPEGEMLLSARFDGSRGYAITAKPTDPFLTGDPFVLGNFGFDPLFTFDLSDPQNPRQGGQLEMPGWVYHMEPRGNRVYALGYDPENPAGSLNVSLFDVTSLEQPQLLSRVNFGGDWGRFAEDQNRIQKAFSLLDDQGLMLVPYSGASYDEASCQVDYGSGIQLVDFSTDTLTRRGVAPQIGNARRALLHSGSLLAIGDNSVQTFDISNRDQPVASGQLDVARNVSAVHVLGDQLMRFGSDWFTQQTILDMTPLDQAGKPQPGKDIDLSSLFADDSSSCGTSAGWGGQVFTKGNYAYVPRYRYSYDNQGNGNYSQQLTFYIVDLAAQDGPKVSGSFSLDPFTQGTNLAGIVQTDNTLLVGRSTGYFAWNDGQIVQRPDFSYDVIDLADPAAPRKATTFGVPAPIAGGGWGYLPLTGSSIDMGWGWSGGSSSGSVALSDGDLVVSQHAELVNDGSGRVRYFLDRLDVSDPDHPRVLPQINIPGTVLQFNAETGELVTLDYVRSYEPGQDWSDCVVRGAYGSFDAERQECDVYRRSLNALVIEGDLARRTSQLSLDQTRRVSGIAVSDTRVFFTTTDFPPAFVTYATLEAPAPKPTPVTTLMLESLRLERGQLVRLPSSELRSIPNTGAFGGQIFARAERLFEIANNRLTVVDTADRQHPATLTHDIPGWGCSALEVAADAAYCAVGQRGVEVIDMSSMR